ncbi:MAG: rhomboid family intramembrane serine protease [Burkholderiales bacterium]
MLPVTLALLIANVAMFMLQMATGNTPMLWFALWPVEGGSNMPPFQIWQLVTYSFLHGGLAHLFFNMFALYMFGSDIERVFGSRWFLIYYTVCVVVAALTHMVVTAVMGLEPLPTVGASGGMFGLLLAFAMYFPERKLLLIFLPVPLPARVFVVLYGAVELFFGVTGTATGIAHFAHLGGMLGGILVIMLRRGKIGRR